MQYKKDFPIFNKHKKLVYLDSAATTQKPKVVIDAVNNFYTENNSNVARGFYDLSIQAQSLYEGSREKIAKFINAHEPVEIIFSGNATEAINLAAFGYFKKYFKKGDIVILSVMEHHSNIVPWIRLKEELGIKLVYLPITSSYELDDKWLETQKIDFKKVKLFSLTQASNVLGTVNQLEELIPYFRKKCINAKFLVDGAQSLPHVKVDVKKLDCDFLAFSAHKMYGPSGVGVLYVRKELLERMDPIFFGGHMILKVKKNSVIFQDVPEKFEAGTGRLEGVIGFAAAIDYMESLGIKNIQKYENSLTEYGLQKLLSIEDIQLYGKTIAENRLPVFSFNLKNIHAHDASEILNRFNIATRAGHHCTQVLMECLSVQGSIRASLSVYNNFEDIDKLIVGITEIKKVFKS